MKVCLSSLLVTEWNLLPKKHTFKEETITYLNTKTTTDRAQQPTSVYLHLRLVFSLGTEKKWHCLYKNQRFMLRSLE